MCLIKENNLISSVGEASNEILLFRCLLLFLYMFFFLEIVFKNSFPNVDHSFFIFAKEINADGRIIFSRTGSYLKLNFMMTLFDVGGSL